VRFSAEMPNERWQADITHVKLADRREVEILNVLDGHSRLLIASDALAVFRAVHVVATFHRAAAVHEGRGIVLRVMRQAVATWIRLALAALVVVALAVQFNASNDRPGFTTVKFLSFFTNQSNLLTVAAYAWLALRRRPLGKTTDLVRGAITTYMAVVGIIYELLLSGDPAAVEATLSWVNTVIHILMPIAVGVDWLLIPPTARIAARESAWWMGFPLVWTTYTLIRGSLDGWYPYPFLNPALHGVVGVAGYAAGIAVAFAVIIAMVVWIGNVRARRAALNPA